MKRFNFLACLFALLALFTFMNKNTAYASQDFEFYYQTVTGIQDLNTEIQEDDSIWAKAKKTLSKGVNAVKRAWEGNVSRVYTLSDGEHKWYSDRNKNLVYNVNRVKVKSEEHLMELMGVSSEDEMTNGQKAMLACYRTAKSDAIKERSNIAYHDKINVILTDTTNSDLTYTDAQGKEKSVSLSDFQHDFWSWSNGSTIHMATHNYNGSNSVADATSTFLHEYCHSIDRTIKELIKPYGKDGSHYGDEMSGKRAAFVEGWAEYNEMIESDAEAQNYLSQMATVCVELKDKDLKNYTFDPDKEWSKEQGGWFCNGISTYTYVSAQDLTAEELWKCEAYNRAALYRIATEIPNGKQKIYDAFKSTRWNLFRDLTTVVKKLCKENPDDIATIGKILDELTYGKMSDKEMKKFIGTSKEAKAFLADRAAGYLSEKSADSSKKVESAADNASDKEAPELTGTSDEEGSVFNVK